MPQDGITIGGVFFPQEILKKNPQGKFFTTLDEKEYIVMFKDDTILRFKEQEPGRQAKVELNNTQHEITFFGIDGATITDTPKDDKYNLVGCENIEVLAGRTKPVSKWRIKAADKDEIKQQDRRLFPEGIVQKSNNNVAYTAGSGVVRGDKVTGGIKAVSKRTDEMAYDELNKFLNNNN